MYCKLEMELPATAHNRLGWDEARVCGWVRAHQMFV